MICTRCKKEHNDCTKWCEPCKVKSREKDKKRREKDPKKFNEKMRTFRSNNKEHMRNYDRKRREKDPEKFRERDAFRNATIHRKYQDFKKGAERRNIPFDITEDFVGTITDKECFYCGEETTKMKRNGIDRLDNTLGYTEDNCVSCCGACNNMKRCLDANTFVERCSQVSLYNGHEGKMCDFWDDIKGYSYSAYKYIMRNKNFQLTKEQYDILRQGNCTYCGRTCSKTHTNGIDRVDNDRGYVLDNCVSCCGSCNIAKGMMNVEEFINKCVLISCKEHDIPEMPRCINIIKSHRP
ncbi:HNH endonuclease [Only Syngen Nebraska virus 5]|uniref:HNH endonuclease n=1 Tax=Only Syngen Nebraska virus 5 TaxID=1917232 RepID=UPI00090190F2|nr:HNH endonuclease [Only Syngen Nebraska virus 5]APC25760.1 hypothetical protein [Only Syngen Nebraska virus 5]